VYVQVKYVKRRKNRDGSRRWYWVRPGFQTKRLSDDADTRAEEAMRLNREADQGHHRAAHPASGADHDERLFGYWIKHYRRSVQWERLAHATRLNYERELAPVERTLADRPLTEINRRLIKHYLDTLPISRRSTALSVFKNVLSRAYDYEAINHLPTLDLRTERPRARTDIIWQQADIDAFLSAAPLESPHAHPQLRLGFLLALHTGQRLSDVLSMTWADYDGEFLRVVQQKTGRKTDIYIASDMRAELANAKARANGTHIVTRMDGQPYNRHAFWRLFERTRHRAELKHLRFHDLRRTAATWLAEAGNDTANICAVTGHSAQSVKTLIDVYVSRTRSMSRAGVERLERHRKKKG
jgi:integrase